MTRFWALLSVFALFLSGLSIGALAMHVYHERRAPPRPFGGPRAPLWDSLELTPQQQRQISEILEQSRRESEEIRGELRPRLERQMEQTRARIRELLGPEQRERLERLEREHRPRLRHYLLGEGPGHGPGPPPEPPPPP